MSFPDPDTVMMLTQAGAVGIALAIVYRQLWKPPPYREGLWVFPSGLTRLSGGWVDFNPISQLGRPTLVTVKRNGSYSHSRLELGHPFTFMFNSTQRADQITTSILAARQHMVNLLAARDTAAIASLDPFAECTISNNWAPPSTLMVQEGPLAAIVPTAATLAQWLGALALGAGAAQGEGAQFRTSKSRASASRRTRRWPRPPPARRAARRSERPPAACSRTPRRHPSSAPW